VRYEVLTAVDTSAIFCDVRSSTVWEELTDSIFRDEE
jgi:hypothetical protein